jgi:FAD dependent oxidoreductase TIGR03364
MQKTTAIVIGAGIVGQAVARALALKGFSVNVIDRSHTPVGASIRNFGMIWPIGQPAGKLYERAIRSRNIWKQIAQESGIWLAPSGSLYLAYHPDEWRVLQESYQAFVDQGRDVGLVCAEKIHEKSEAVLKEGLLGALYSDEELILDPREAMRVLPAYLSEKYNIKYCWGKCVSYISDQTVYIGNEEEYEADLVFLCSGADLETLYPKEYAQFPVTKCKLQMMRLASQPSGWQIGPALCGGLSLTHYKSFQVAEGLDELKHRYREQMAEYLQWGIHVMVSQNGKGELTIGDSHEYGLTHDPFDKQLINSLIIRYLKTFAQFRDWRITETWNGIYPILTNGQSDIFFSPEPFVYIINGVGGAGMTSSFALAEELVADL